MAIIKTTPSFRPKCPVCGEYLEGCGFPLPSKGTGICPGGPSYDFEVEVDNTKTVKDKLGRLSKAVGWKITGDDNVPHK